MQRYRWEAYLFLIPGLTLFCLWTIYPIVRGLQISFYHWDLIRLEKNIFVGIENYTKFFADPIAILAVRNTLLYTIVTVPGQMIFGLIVAVLLDTKIKGKVVFRTLYYLPVVTSWVVVSFIFMYLFNSDFGLVNYILKDLLRIISQNIAWLQNPSTAFWVIMLLGIWKGIGWNMVIFLAALQNIPQELYESATIDGANSWQLFRRITIPLIRPTILFVMVMLTIGGFNVFISVNIITGGGPLHQTEVVLSYMYQQAFNFLDFGYGSAISYMLAMVILIISYIQIKFLKIESLY
jgi:multiple sugar transport system permease protein